MIGNLENGALAAGLSILKPTYDPSNQVLFERCVENPTYLYFCGEEPSGTGCCSIDSSLRRRRNRVGKERLQRRFGPGPAAIKPSQLSRVIVDTPCSPRR
jgi:hypothetical protein